MNPNELKDRTKKFTRRVPFHFEHAFLGSARVARAGKRVPAIANFPYVFSSLAVNEGEEKFLLARRQNQHAGRVRYPDELVAIMAASYISASRKNDTRRGKSQSAIKNQQSEIRP